MKKILVPLDFNEQSLIALDIAVQIAERIKGTVRSLHVLDYPSIGELMKDYVNIEKWEDLEFKMEDRAKEKLESIIAKDFEGKGIVSDVITGKVLSEILSYQKVRKFDMMVLGVKKTSGFGAHYYGSFTDRIVNKSSIPVLVVKEKIQFRSIKKVIFVNAFKIKETALSEKVSMVKSLLKDPKIDIVRVNTPSDFMHEDIFDGLIRVCP